MLETCSVECHFIFPKFNETVETSKCNSCPISSFLKSINNFYQPQSNNRKRPNNLMIVCNGFSSLAIFSGERNIFQRSAKCHISFRFGYFQSLKIDLTLMTKQRQLTTFSIPWL